MKLRSNQIAKAEKLKVKRSKYRKYLKRGDMTSIAKSSGVSVQMVYRWFSGEVVNSPVGYHIELLTEARGKAIKESIGDKIKL